MTLALTILVLMVLLATLFRINDHFFRPKKLLVLAQKYNLTFLSRKDLRTTPEYLDRISRITAVIKGTVGKHQIRIMDVEADLLLEFGKYTALEIDGKIDYGETGPFSRGWLASTKTIEKWIKKGLQH